MAESRYGEKESSDEPPQRLPGIETRNGWGFPPRADEVTRKKKMDAGRVLEREPTGTTKKALAGGCGDQER